MNIRQLEHLMALAETGSFSRAAERLYITQSAFSRSIQGLEDELGGALVDCIGKRNELTPLGQTVLRRARAVVREAEELRRSAQLMNAGDGGEIRVGLGSGPGALLMTQTLRHVAEHHPRLRLRIARGSTELQLLQLRARELDAMVVDVRRVAPAADLHIEPLAEVRAGFIVAARHPLARARRIRFEDLLGWPIASSPLSDEVARLLIEQYGPQADPASLVGLQCEDIASLLHTVEHTEAIFLGIVAAAADGLQSGRLRELAVTPALRARARFAYVTLHKRTEAPAMAMFREFVAQRIASWKAPGN